MSTARLGSFDDLLSELSAETLAKVPVVARALRETVLEGYPDAVEVVRLGDGAASYGVGLKKMSESHVYVAPKRDYVNLGFWHGVELPDPAGRLEGTGRKMRHVKVRDLEDARSDEIRDLIAAALADRRRALGLE